MIVSPRSDQFKPFTQFSGETSRIVSIDWQPAASFRAVGGKCSNDDMTTGLDGLFHARDIGRAVRRISQEMEGGPIMPQVEGLG